MADNNIDIEEILESWRKMSTALEAESYRVQGQGYGVVKAINFCKPYHEPGTGTEPAPETLWNAARVEREIARLKKYNTDRNIYCLPIREDTGFLLLDDVMEPELVRENVGLPSLEIESSEKNFQFIYRVKIPGLNLLAQNEPREVANRLVRVLNTKWGDPHLSGIFHQFRIPGFVNRKPGRGNFPVQLVAARRGLWADFNEDIVAEADNCSIAAAAREKTQKEPPKMTKTINNTAKWKATAPTGAPRAHHVFCLLWNREFNFARKKGWFSVDLSGIDFRAICRMKEKGCFSEPEIYDALFSCSPLLSLRHPNSTDYVTRTLQAAALQER